MSATTPYSQWPGDVADTCRDAAADIGVRLRALRAHLAGLDPAALGMPAARLGELLAGFDIYARMLDDALDDIACELHEHRPAEQGAARRPGGAGQPGTRRCDVALAGGSVR